MKNNTNLISSQTLLALYILFIYPLLIIRFYLWSNSLVCTGEMGCGLDIAYGAIIYTPIILVVNCIICHIWARKSAFKLLYSYIGNILSLIIWIYFFTSLGFYL